MRSSFWQQLVSFPAMLVSILFVSPFFASLDVQQGGPVMRDPDLWWHLRNAQVSTYYTSLYPPGYLFLHHSRSAMDQSRMALPRSLTTWRSASSPSARLPGDDLCHRSHHRRSATSLLSNAQAKSPHHGWLTWIAFCLQPSIIGPRTILFGWLCFLAEMLILEVFRRGRDRLWLLVPLFAYGSIFTVPGSLAMASSCSTSHRAGGGLVGQHRIRAMDPAAMAKADYSRDCLAGGAFSLTHMAGGLWSIRLISSSVSNSTWLWSTNGTASIFKLLRHGRFLIATGIMLFTLAQRRSWLLSDVLFALLAFYAALTHKPLSVPRWHHRLPMLSIELATTSSRLTIPGRTSAG